MIKRFQGVLSLALLCSFCATGLAQVITPPEPAPERTPSGQGTSSDQQLQQVVVEDPNHIFAIEMLDWFSRAYLIPSTGHEAQNV